jgi:hypothetical protein
LPTALTNHVRSWSKHFGIPVHLHINRPQTSVGRPSSKRRCTVWRRRR